MTEPNAMNATINRHMARLLTDLTEAGCPAVFREAVKSAIKWLRSDLNELNERGDLNELVSTLPR